ncbi:MAG: malto-oligosyltrehalose synthase, partial [Propionicimonas sp.]|uniref:malto-oligosyltrehalose synthase n=1 Tax=Propionicimonas sp. TaxID=1955623 RepID=UPI002B1ED49D
MHRPASGRRTPLNTYRLQLSAAFTFADACARLPYLDALGVTDLYLSPILTATPGSAHGYDVVDPTTVSAERGGRDGFEALAAAAHARGMGVVVDIVPNHLAIPDPLWLNPALWSALRDGPESGYADWFDIEAGAALVLPVVTLDGDDDPIPRLITDRRLRFGSLDRPDGPEPVLLLDDKPYPLAPHTAGLPLAEAAACQHYSLQRWQGNHTRLTHRRFFDIVTLIGVRQELPDVFDATHAELLDLYRGGSIDGFRVDHPDGLADPEVYFERLREATGGAWVVAEKILTGDELLPPAWPVCGTTGYEAAWRFDAVQLDPAAAEPLAQLAQRTDSPAADAQLLSWPEVAEAAKRYLADTSLAIDVDRLIRLARQVDPAWPEADLRTCLREFLVAMDRYRAYVRPGRPADGVDAAVLTGAAERAATRLPEQLQPILTRLHDLAAGTMVGPARPAVGVTKGVTDTGVPTDSGVPTGASSGVPGDPTRGGVPEDPPIRARAAAEFAVRFQQVTGALVAKGVEDTAFYRWTQLLTLCDVGSDPGSFGLTPQQLHDWLGRMHADWPATMALGSTHDSKRSADVRARIAAISEYPAEWTQLVADLTPAAADLPAPLRTILWQTLAGTWTDAGPIDTDRLAAFAVKAGREQKLWTSWVSPDGAAEARVAGAVPRLVADPLVRQRFDAWIRLVADSVRTNTLCATLLRLTALGVADTYQGCETVRLSLTDPDNRRPVDWEQLAANLPPKPGAIRAAEGYLPSGAGISPGLGEAAAADGPDARLATDKLLLTTT